MIPEEDFIFDSISFSFTLRKNIFIFNLTKLYKLYISYSSL